MSEYSRGYARGYAAGLRGRWPQYLPPEVPDPLVQELIESARLLADRVDNWYATIEEEAREYDECGMESARVRVLEALSAIRSHARIDADESPSQVRTT